MTILSFFRRAAATLLVVLASASLARTDYVDPNKLPFLRPGDRAPAFHCVDDEGHEWKSSQHYGKKVIVVCFYLGDFFKPCTEELRVLRDHLGELAAEEVEII